MSNWVSFFRDLGDATARQAAEELQSLLASCAADVAAEVRERAEDLDRTLNQLAAGEIDAEDLDMYLADWQDLARMRMNQREVRAQAAMQRLIDGVQEQLINRLCRLL